MFIPQAEMSSHEILFSEGVNFVSEWRCFVRYGKISGIQFYFGDRNVECDRSVIENAVREYKDIPAGCSLDFGVTERHDSWLHEAGLCFRRSVPSVSGKGGGCSGDQQGQRGFA